MFIKDLEHALVDVVQHVGLNNSENGSQTHETTLCCPASTELEILSFCKENQLIME